MPVRTVCWVLVNHNIDQIPQLANQRRNVSNDLRNIRHSSKRFRATGYLPINSLLTSWKSLIYFNRVTSTTSQSLPPLLLIMWHEIKSLYFTSISCIYDYLLNCSKDEHVWTLSSVCIHTKHYAPLVHQPDRTVAKFPLHLKIRLLCPFT